MKHREGHDRHDRSCTPFMIPIVQPPPPQSHPTQDSVLRYVERALTTFSKKRLQGDPPNAVDALARTREAAVCAARGATDSRFHVVPRVARARTARDVVVCLP